jgi:hypothetical protein
MVVQEELITHVPESPELHEDGVCVKYNIR